MQLATDEELTDLCRGDREGMNRELIIFYRITFYAYCAPLFVKCLAEAVGNAIT